MNKISTILALALAVGFTACNEFDLPNPPGQSNPEVPVYNFADLKLERTENFIDLSACVEMSQNAVLSKVVSFSNLSEPYEYEFVVDIADNDSFDKAVSITAMLDGDNIALLPTDLNSLIYNNFTKDPASLEVYTRISAYAVYGATKIRLGEPDQYLCDGYPYEVLPFAPAHVIDGSYYMLTRAIGATSWSVTAALPFTQVAPGSPYDNPVFMIKFDVPAEGLEWAVLPGTNFHDGNLNEVYGVSDAAALDGYLLSANGESAVAGVITEESPYSLTINMEDLSYKVAFAYEMLYVISNNNTNFATARHLTTTDFLSYSGYARLQNMWYLTGQANLDGALFMNTGEATVSDEGVIKGEIMLTNKADEEAEQMKAADGLYNINVNLGLMTYTATRINTISLIGGYNEWNLETAVDFTPSSTSLVWNLKDIELPEGEVKFCCNHAWTYDFGGEEGAVAHEGELVSKGANIKVEEAGKYDIKLNFNTIPPSYTFTKK